MINASKEFKEKLKNGAVLANFADITLSDGTVLHLEPKDFMIGGCQIDDKTTDGKFGVGLCIGKTLKIRLENDDERFSSYDFYMSIITLYVGMLLDDGTIEKIRKGKYCATIPQTQGDIIEISAVDDMYKLDRPYAATTSYPATLQSIISDICLDCGIPMGFTQFDNYTYTVQEKPENVTYRQVLSYACQVAGYNAHIDNDGYMQLIWYNTSLLNLYNYNGGSFKTYPHDTILDGGDFTNYGQGERISGGEFTDPRPEHIFRIKSLNVHTDDVVITGVKVIGKDDVTALFGEEGYAIVVKGNPFVDGKESEVASYLGGRMVGMAFRPFSAQILSNPLYEPFEVVMVSDRKGNVYNSIVNSVSYKIGAFTQVSCQAEDPVRNGSQYISPAVQAAIAEARKNAEKQISTYDKAVQQLNQIAMNSMGFHTTYEEQPDGSRIVYLHDKPNLEDSTTIYKQTIDGFFISTDGGKSYTAGFDKNGNVVVNVLNTIGIQADWIRVTDLYALGATIAGWRISVSQIYKYINIYPDMTSSGLSGVGENDPVQYWCWIREPVDNDTPVFGVYYNRKKDFLSNNSTVYPYFYVKTNGKMYAKNADISGTITLGGKDNTNGSLSVYDASGGLTARLNNGGLTVYKGDIQGSNIRLGGSNNQDGSLTLYGASGSTAAKLDNNGLVIYKGNIQGTNIKVGGSNNQDGVLSAYDSSRSLRVELKSGGMYLYETGAYLGIIGTSHKTNDVSKKGIAFLAETPTDYMTFSYKKSGESSYNPIFEMTTDKSGRVCDMFADLDMNLNDILSTSDERLKYNIAQSDIDALSLINGIETYSFDWIENDKHESLGFIAQQLETVNEDFVRISENTGKYSAKEVSLIPYLVKAVQQLSEKITELQAEISELKGEKSVQKVRKMNGGQKWEPTQYTKEEKIAYAKSLNPEIVYGE